MPDENSQAESKEFDDMPCGMYDYWHPNHQINDETSWDLIPCGMYDYWHPDFLKFWCGKEY